MKLIKSITNANRVVKVYRDPEWDEYVCRLFVNGKENKGRLTTQTMKLTPSQLLKLWQRLQL